MENYCRALQATDDNMADAHCVLGTKYTNTHSEYVILTVIPRHVWLRQRELSVMFSSVLFITF